MKWGLSIEQGFEKQEFDRTNTKQQYLQNMSGHSLKNSVKFQSKKLLNLQELSISNIWDNKYQDESSDFQHERYLINNIKANNIDPEHEYGLTSFRNKETDLPAHPAKRFKIEILNRKYKSLSEFQNKSQLKSKLTFNKYLKRKKSVHREKSTTNHSVSTKTVRPVPRISQHYFKHITDAQQGPLENKEFSEAPQICIIFRKQSRKVATNLYQIPFKKIGFGRYTEPNKQVYHLINDEVKYEINDDNSSLSKPLIPKAAYFPPEKLIESPQATVKFINLAGPSNLNETKLLTRHSELLPSQNYQNKVLEIIQYYSFDSKSNLSSHNSDRKKEWGLQSRATKKKIAGKNSRESTECLMKSESKLTRIYRN